MKLALNDPIWDRLYGPYGVEPVAEILAELDTQWNAETANNLFWEMLHHQETLYPVTYAALPWLFEIAKRTPDAAVELGVFFSQVIYSAGFPSENAQSARFSGLSTNPSKHQHSWIEPSQRLRDADAKMLYELELWFDQNKKEMADFAVGLCKSANPEDVGYLLRGYAALAGALLLVHTLEAAAGAEAWVLCPACEREFLAVWKQDAPEFEMYTGPGAEDRVGGTPDIARLQIEWKAARELADLVRTEQPKIAGFLDVYSSWRCCEGEDQQTFGV